MDYSQKPEDKARHQLIDPLLKKAEKLRKSILKSAFEGKLVKFEEVRE